MQTVTMVITGLSMGITIYVGQKTGEKNNEEAGKAIGSGIALFVVRVRFLSGYTICWDRFFAE